MSYLSLAGRELWSYGPQEFEIAAPAETIRVRALLVALANSPQYGNGAIIAPRADLTDGMLDLVIVEHRPAPVTILHARRLFNATIDRTPGIVSRRVTEVRVTSDRPIPFHVDGETCEATTSLEGRVRPAALLIMADCRRQIAD
jgi:diacylglycerol kinase family enzyme